MESVEIDLSQINHSNEVILTTRKELSLNDIAKESEESSYDFCTVGFSRVSFSYDRKKATFYYHWIRNGLDGKGFNVYCEYRNGAWFLVKQEMVWIS